MPIQADHVWGWFWELHKRRRPCFSSSPHPIMHADMLAFCEVEKVDMDADERNLVLMMDDALVSTWRELAANEARYQAQQNEGRRNKVSPKERGAV